MTGRIIKIIPAVMLMVMIMSETAFGYVDRPSDPSQKDMTIAELNGYTQEQWDKICDYSIEYDELRDRLRNFNPDIASGWDTYKTSVMELQDSKYTLADARKNTNDMIDAYRMLPDGPQKELAIGTAQTSKKVVSKAETGVVNSINAMKKESNKYNRKLITGEDRLLEGVQSLMIAYGTVLSQKETLQTLMRLYQESYDAQTALAQKGLATFSDVTAAQVNLLSAQSSASSLAATERDLYRNIIVLCGYNENDQVSIGSVPQPDTAKIGTYDPNADYEKAAGNNMNLQAVIETPHKHTEKGISLWEGNIEAKKGVLHANLVLLYNDVISAKQQMDAAQAGFMAAEENRKAADKQFELGLTTKAQYLGQTITCVQKKAALESAKLGLVQSMLTYESAVNGNCSID